MKMITVTFAPDAKRPDESYYQRRMTMPDEIMRIDSAREHQERVATHHRLLEKIAKELGDIFNSFIVSKMEGTNDDR